MYQESEEYQKDHKDVIIQALAERIKELEYDVRTYREANQQNLERLRAAENKLRQSTK